VFDHDQHLFFSIGERGVQEHAQDLTRPNGKIHRLMDDGEVPPDNPFAAKDGACRSIWSYGHRNPQGLVLDSATGRLWETEHGPRGGDELNLIRKAANYGWPRITYGINYNGTPITDRTEMPGMEQPLIHWTPSIAVCSLDLYRGDKFPRWRDNLFATALAQEELRRLVVAGDRVVEQEVLFKGIGRVRDVVAAPDGLIYVVLNKPDRLVRLVPAGD
jgi:glucose/arabinose dehydrogenase